MICAFLEIIESQGASASHGEEVMMDKVASLYTACEIAKGLFLLSCKPSLCVSM